MEQGFGWDKTIGLLDKLRHRGKKLVGWAYTFTSAAYNLVRLRTLVERRSVQNEGVGVGLDISQNFFSTCDSDRAQPTTTSLEPC